MISKKNFDKEVKKELDFLWNEFGHNESITNPFKEGAEWTYNLIKNHSDLSNVIDSDFIEVFDKADCVKHWHDTCENNEGMVVSSEKVYELWEVLKKHRDYRDSL